MFFGICAVAMPELITTTTTQKNIRRTISLSYVNANKLQQQQVQKKQKIQVVLFTWKIYDTIRMNANVPYYQAICKMTCIISSLEFFFLNKNSMYRYIIFWSIWIENEEDGRKKIVKKTLKSFHKYFLSDFSFFTSIASQRTTYHLFLYSSIYLYMNENIDQQINSYFHTTQHRHFTQMWIWICSLNKYHKHFSYHNIIIHFLHPAIFSSFCIHCYIAYLIYINSIKIYYIFI